VPHLVGPLLVLSLAAPSPALAGPPGDPALIYAVPGTRFRVRLPSREEVQEAQRHHGRFGKKKEVRIPSPEPTSKPRFPCGPSFLLTARPYAEDPKPVLEKILNLAPVKGMKKGEILGLPSYRFTQAPLHGAFYVPMVRMVEGTSLVLVLHDPQEKVFLEMRMEEIFPDIKECEAFYEEGRALFKEMQESLELAPKPAPPQRGRRVRGERRRRPTIRLSATGVIPRKVATVCWDTLPLSEGCSLLNFKYRSVAERKTRSCSLRSL